MGQGACGHPRRAVERDGPGHQVAVGLGAQGDRPGCRDARREVAQHRPHPEGAYGRAADGLHPEAGGGHDELEVVGCDAPALAVHAADIDYRISSVLAFLVAVANNFLINRIWTFDGHHGKMGMQALRFFAVSLAVFAVTWVLLQVLVGAGLAEVVAQAISVGLGTPLNFIGNKLWSFSKHARRR